MSLASPPVPGSHATWFSLDARRAMLQDQLSHYLARLTAVWQGPSLDERHALLETLAQRIAACRQALAELDASWWE